MKEVSLDENNEDDFFILHPGEFALGVTYENITIANDILGRLDGKSSVARLGIFVHVTAASHFPGSSANMTLELYNAATLPVKLYYKMPIAQMIFEKVSTEVENGYGKNGSKYKNDIKPKASQYYKNFNK
jgi:dCTP deaminase